MAAVESSAGDDVKIRLVVTLRAPAGKGAELAAALRVRSLRSRREPGCDEFEVLQSALDPDLVVLLELWADQAALDAHHARAATLAPPYDPALKPLGMCRERYLHTVAR